ncbi:hypothetical protein [Rhizobium binae]|uniref:Uncharacterized protein n=1 Tax=Rhizobium binae TaxID=1138190 RepID=A0ABV2MA45_9HYPH|nr:hypothetical protein [Rhizobium binae]NKL51333.1 hypothetical protein [Rhizobium leguminosarum bv. viciae]MBX4941811.1 hypothetical protein [Rhizobium binae]MBX4947826.1 hypothetical protein [Rhizobium binae]MBX4965718.1 hypothetical protein [Rhizobium binae]MBX4966081.1 hypothetical protein [Rhizobium binae]
MKRLLLSTLLVISTAPVSAHACAVPRPMFSGLFEADLIIRGTLISYDLLEMRSKVRVTFEVTEILKGSAGSGQLSAIWERSKLPDRWKGPQDAIVALRRSNASAEATYAIVQPTCGSAEIYGAKDRSSVMHSYR